MPNAPSMEQRRAQLEAREPPLALELVALLMRLHELRLAAPASLQAIANKAAELDSEARKWGPNRVDEHLTARGNLTLPALAVRAALVELSCPPPSAGRRSKRMRRRAWRELAAEIDTLTVAAARAAGEETNGKLLISTNSREDDPTPKRRRRAVLAVSAVAVAVGAATLPVMPGSYAAHERFEQCIASKALRVDPDRGPMRTLVEWSLAVPPPNSTKYTVRNESGALQATVIFTSSSQAAREVLEANQKFYGEHGNINNDYTVGDTTVITPQLAGASDAAHDCANGA